MSEADSYQIGGEHYKEGGYHHWNLVQRVRLGYLEGCTTKYVARCRKKEKLVEDLRKAHHYLTKLREEATRDEDQLALPYRPTIPEILVEVIEFSRANRLTPEETLYTWMLCTWDSLSDLEAAGKLLTHMLAQLGVEPGAPIAHKPVPLTEENHHADRMAEPYRFISEGIEWLGRD